MEFDGVTLVGFTTVELPMLGVSPSESYICKGIDNLGQVGFDVFMQPTVKRGVVYGGRRPQPLELLIKIGLNPNYGLAETPQSLRQKIYGLLCDSSGYEDLIQMYLDKEGDTIAYINGVVKAIEPDIFSKDPSVGVTLACEGSYLQGPGFTIGAATGDVTVDNPGDAPAGFLLQCDVNGTPAEWILYNGDGTKWMKFTYAFANDDHIIIDTREGHRKVYIERSGVPHNMYPYLSDDSTWLRFGQGSNTLDIPEADTQAGSVNLTYTPLYWGV